MTILEQEIIDYCKENPWTVIRNNNYRTEREVIIKCGDYNIQFIIMEKICVYLHSIGRTIPAIELLDRLEEEYPELLL